MLISIMTLKILYDKNNEISKLEKIVDILVASNNYSYKTIDINYQKYLDMRLDKHKGYIKISFTF